MENAEYQGMTRRRKCAHADLVGTDAVSRMEIAATRGAYDAAAGLLLGRARAASCSPTRNSSPPFIITHRRLSSVCLHRRRTPQETDDRAANLHPREGSHHVPASSGNGHPARTEGTGSPQCSRQTRRAAKKRLRHPDRRNRACGGGEGRRNGDVAKGWEPWGRGSRRTARSGAIHR
jgi:hypothetical protein